MSTIIKDVEDIEEKIENVIIVLNTFLYIFSMIFNIQYF